MIIQEFNNGWGDHLPLRQFEKSITDQYLGRLINDASRTVLINSTWYTQHYHVEVMRSLADLRPDRVILITMMDPAIAQPEWYSQICHDIWGVGYYTGDHEIDAWALIVSRYFQVHPHCGDHTKLDTAYICLNRKPHWHRVQLYRQLDALGLVDQGIVTLGGPDGSAVRTLPDDQAGSDLAPNSGIEQYGIANDIMTLGLSENWNRCLLNLVTETVFDVDRQWFVSEKIYKPVLGLRPFLVYAPNGARSWLDHVGIESYTDDFRDISDLDPADPTQLPGFIGDLCEQSTSYFQQKYLALRDKIHYNKDMFDQHVRRTWDRVARGILCQI